jgi:hypothetical protein
MLSLVSRGAFDGFDGLEHDQFMIPDKPDAQSVVRMEDDALSTRFHKERVIFRIACSPFQSYQATSLSILSWSWAAGVFDEADQ